MRTRSNSYSKKKVKISQDNFEILQPYQFSEFLNYDYNVKQLKLILKSYKLKQSGNKNELTNRIYKHMKYTYNAVIIQKNFRMYVIKQFFNIVNNSRKNELQNYNNESDFYTMEKIDTISSLYLYSYKDIDGFLFAFKISSLIKYIDTSKTNEIHNPYNRKVFSNDVIKNVSYINRVYKLYSHLCEIEGDVEIILTRKQKIILKLTDQFHIIDTLGNYSDINWILSLNKQQIVIFLREFYDIWNYRAQLTDTVKKEVCPPNGMPFIDINMSMINRHQEYNFLLENCTRVFDKLLNANTTDANKSLGALYILSGLTLVSQNAADALPWLYQSVAI